MKRFVALLWLTVAAAPLAAQGNRPRTLRDTFFDLFRFGGAECGAGVLLCLVNSSGVSAAEAFSTNANATATTLTQFVQSSITQGLANLPTPSTSSGLLFRLSGLGVPVPDETQSAGPIFGERALTLGRTKWLVGANLTDLTLAKLRGTPIDAIAFNVAQRDLPPGGGVLGDPPIEQTYLHVDTRIGLQARVLNLFMTYGLRDNFDVGVTVPVVQAALSGYSDARIVPGQDTDPAAGFSFGGPPEDPRLITRTVIDRVSRIGIGDVAVRAKYRLTRREAAVGIGFLADVRLPTGAEENFHGSGSTWIRGMAAIAWRTPIGTVPHLNVGYYWRRGTGFRDAVLVNVGFDQRLSGAFTLAGNLLGQQVLGQNPLQTEQFQITGQAPFLTSNIPTRRDDVYDLSLGIKYTRGALTALVNGIAPMNQGGLRSELLLTSGLQVTF